MLRNSLRFVLSLSSSLLAASAIPTAARAQAAAITAEKSAVEEVVVTARRRTERLQEVPITATVLTSQALEDSNITSVVQLNNIVPGLLVAPVANNSLAVTLRGLGTNPGGQSFDQSVAVFFDGIFAPHAREYLSGIYDLERVEAIKGTQTALLGKNTSLGALSFTSRKPSDQFRYNLQASQEFELKSSRVEAGVDLPLGPKSDLRIAGLYSDQGGWVHNSFYGDEGPEAKIQAVRLTWVWRPTAQLDLTAGYEHQRFRSEGQGFEIVVDRTGRAASLAAAAGSKDFETAFNQRSQSSSPLAGKPTDEQDTDRGYASINYDFGPVTFTSLTGLTWYNSRRLNDIDFLPSDYFNRFEYESDRKVSQEFRITSRPQGRLSYVGGAYFLKDVWRLNQVVAGSANWVFPGSYSGQYSQRVSSKSVFAQAEFAFTDRFKGTGGVRYTHEDKDAVLSRNTVTPGPLVNGQSGPFPETRLSRRESNLDGSVGLQYQLFPRGIVYASWSQGSKSGGFQTTPTAIRGVPTGAEYAGETARTDEVGAKLTSPDGHFNIALFNTDVDGFQNLFNTGAVLVVQNLQVRSRGVEIDAVQRLSDTWSVNFAATYADAEDRTNRLRLTRAPKWSGVGSLSLRQPLSDSFVLRATAEVEFRSSAYLAPPGGVIPLSSSYSKLNLRVAIADERSGWELALIGKNLTDERIASFGFPLPNVAQTAVVGSEMPRTIALQFSLHR